MADKSKTIREATDAELSAILYRIRREKDCLQLLREIQANSTPNPSNPYPDWEKLGPFSTETIVYNGRSIKQMTDQELSEYLDRLRNENELLNIIQNIVRYNKPLGGDVSSETNSYPGINLNIPIEDLYHKGSDNTLEHYGVPGMKWYVSTKSKGQMEIHKKTFETQGTIAKEGSNLLGMRRKSKEEDYSNQMRKKAKEMSDDELKKTISRLNMEQQYRNLTTSDVAIGRSKTEKYLERAGSIMTIAAAGVGLALTIKQLMPAKVASKVAGG